MANIKELAKQPERLSSGHRLCAGCGASIVVRQVLMGTKDPVVVGASTGCLEVATTIYPYTAWKAPFIHNAFENVAATISGVETAYRALKKQGKIKKDIKFVAFGGDGGTYDIGLQALSGALERGHNFVYVCYNNEAYMNCLSTDSMIMTEPGLKKITEVKEGDSVYAFDQKTHKLVLKECSGVFDNGVKDVYELNTLHHSIKATSNHPFLVLKRSGTGKTNQLVWKKLEDVNIGDEVVALKGLNGFSKSAMFDFKKTKKGDYKVNKLNDINIPRSSSPELMKYLGLYIGDGWVREKRGEVGFALPEKTIGRRELVKIHAKIFGSKINATDKIYVYANSVNLGNFIKSLGVGIGAKNKTIPGWAFTLPVEQKEALVEGLMLSDGYKCGNSWRYVSVSEDLLKSLRLFLQTMGKRVGKIHWQVKKKGTVCATRRLLKDSKYGYICFSNRTRWNIEKYPNQYRNQNFLIGNEYFEMEKIKSIKLVGKEPTLDLRVEGEHNFIADGIVVHNTGIQRSGATPKGASTTTAPAGKASYGKRQFRKDLTSIVAAHRIPYVAQASASSWNDLVTKSEKAFKVDGPAFLNVISMCHRGWRFPQEDTIKISKLAVETGFWPLIEIENGQWKFTYKPKERKPVIEFLKPQGRFKHLFKEENKHVLEEIQKDIDDNWARLEHLCEASCKVA
ncbi:MAG: hypothetical protein KKG21_07225 [Candidatus Omnitrophica bacterium]|nr:hypothetical protein [Candidatus Omnitrophota bacterium]